MVNGGAYLFGGTSAFAVVESMVGQAVESVKQLTEDQILNATDDALINDAVRRCIFVVPEIVDDQIYTEEHEVERIVSARGYDIYSDSHGDGQRKVKRHVVEFHVPFEGAASYFTIAPSNRSIAGPYAQVVRQELVISIETASKTAEQIKGEFESTLSSIKQHLATLQRDLAGARSQIEGFAQSHIPARRVEILRNKNLVASLGYPMRRRADAPATYKPSDVRRKITPARPVVHPPFTPEPALDEKEYQHILSVLDNMTKVMERSPRTFAGMEEEDIRQHFLVQLNGQYEGQATGETFNAEGKTDILIRSEGRNIFVAECKIWRGEKSFEEAVGQLLGYMTWRDTKSALIIFNKNKNLTSVVSKIREKMNSHEHMKRGPKVESATRLQYVFGNPGDHDREIKITVMVYDIPDPS